ncbi:hypothetical protein Phum_PHUM348100 [Pediculus humanus corporis]|uniref:Uncharacterized protein n=1 Tax=Pediculus humanus subsp. corporis TaxID=121224 RepID=E0VNZ3_PEDHC|nr:uncharacterized protein Phum_PHUM348100 [Pediculus humanus corporis]EEB15099.1 hypothetical protein Phum_PHUM348100 [Pediculus humanus corporis]
MGKLGKISVAELTFQYLLTSFSTANLKSTKSEMNRDGFQFKHYPYPDDHILLGNNSCGVKTFINGISWTEPLSWSTTFCPSNNINIRAAIVFFKLGLIEVVEKQYLKS